MPESSGDMTAAFSTALSSASTTPAATASPAVTPETASTPADTSAPAATTPAATGPQASESATTETPETPQGETPKGTPPQWRWQDILANTRETVAKETEARIRQEYDGLKDFAQIDANERAGLLTLRAALSGDPQALAHVRANTAAVQAIQRLIAAEQRAEDQEPQPDLQSADGTLVYSAAQQAKREAWLKERWLGEIRQEIQPLKQAAQTSQQRERLTTYKHTAGEHIAKLKSSDPDFTAHMADVAALINTDPRLQKIAIGDPARPDIDPDPAYAIDIAWDRVYRAKVVPAKQKTSEADVLANLQQRAVASAVNPSAATPSTPKKFTGFGEALQHFSQTGTR